MRNDLTGQKFERLTVLGFSHRDKGGRAKWSCVCDCGNERTVDGHKLTSGHTKSCGCLSAELAKKRSTMDITGHTYGKLTVIKRAGKNRFGQYLWECSCECGNNAVVPLVSMRTGKTKSCGCLKGTNASHGHSRKGKITVEYSTWTNLRKRCFNRADKKFADYGGRGITVCDRWANSFEAFFADMGERPSPAHSIDRIDNDGPYSPDNCRWATRAQQASNKRVPKNTVYITLGAVTKTIPEWSDITGLSQPLIRSRLKRGWAVERILTQKPHR